MWNLSEIMRAAQGGQAMVNLAQQLGLSQADAQKAVQALLPAFSLGLQRQTQTATNFAAMLGLMSTGNFLPFFDGARAQEPSQLADQGHVVIDRIFGTPEISRQVAAHAAVLSGVQTEVLMRMLPLMGAMIMGGLFKAAMESGFAGVFGQMSEALKKAGFGAAGLTHVPEAESLGAPTGDIFGPLMASLFGPIADGPVPTTDTPSKDAPGTLASPDPTAQGIAQLSRLFETGTQVQRDYIEAMQRIFDSFTRKAPGS